MNPDHPPRRTSFAIGWEAARANLMPGLMIQAAMLGIVLAYYLSPAAAGWLSRLAEMKRAYGLVFTIGAMICVGAVLPELLLICCFQGGRPRIQNLRNFLFNAPFWSFDGMMVDLMYRTEAAWFGDKATVAVVLAKICVDQFGYNPVFAAPYGVWGYEWKNRGYSWSALRRAVNWRNYRDKVIPTLVTTWVVWMPLMAMIYSLPLALQFPLFSLALTFWVLLLTYMTNAFASKPQASAQPTALVVGGVPENIS